MRLEDLVDETCEWCGAPYEAKRYDQKFCCRECAVASYIADQVADYQAKARADNTGCVCPQCGVTFDATNRNQKYCSRACTIKAANDRARGKPLAEALAELRCRECGGPIPHAVHTNTHYCRPCKARRRHAQELASSRRYKARKRDREYQRRKRVRRQAD